MSMLFGSNVEPIPDWFTTYMQTIAQQRSAYQMTEDEVRRIVRDEIERALQARSAHGSQS